MFFQQLPLLKYSPIFIRVAIQAGEIKIINSEVVPGVFIKAENKGLFNDGISGKFTINSGSLRGFFVTVVLCLESSAYEPRWFHIIKLSTITAFDWILGYIRDSCMHDALDDIVALHSH